MGDALWLEVAPQSILKNIFSDQVDNRCKHMEN